MTPSNETIIRKYNNFLKKYEVGKEVKVGLTHTTFGSPWSKYIIPDEELDTFYELYSQVIGKVDLYVIERPKPVGQLLIDIDWHITSKNREYTLDDIEYVVKAIKQCLKKYYKLFKKKLLAFVFEKSRPCPHQKNEGVYKDGFHIVYPNFIMDEQMRFLIIDDLKKMIEKDNPFSHVNSTNAPDDVVDKSVIRSNGWCMYGSRKYSGRMYRLTHIYDHDLNELEIDQYTVLELVKLLSNRKDKAPLELKEEVNNFELKKRLEQYDDKKKKKKSLIDDDDNPFKNQKEDDGDEDDDPELSTEQVKRAERRDDARQQRMTDAELAKKLVKCLSRERASGYDTWTRTGWCLHNISKKLLPTFKRFSQKTNNNNYDEEACEKLWNEAKNGGLSIASLHHWAKGDNPKMYSEIMRKNINELFVKAETGTEWDMAKVICEFYPHQYKCTSLTKKTWYEFQEHRWVEVESAYTLREKMSEEITKEFAMLSSTYYRMASAADGIQKDDFLKKGQNVMKIMLQLKRGGFKERVINECAIKYYDPKFEEELDSKKDLLGFDNGVFDLSAGIFRPGTPDDCISLSCKYNYKEYHAKHEYIKEIKDYFKKNQIDEVMREYILTLLASYLDGHVNESFILWTGTGANGKSKTVEFFQNAIGDYAGEMPVTALTKKRGGAGEATPHLADKRGKRFVVFQEPEGDDKICVGYMKELTGNDRMMARPLYKDPFYFRPQFKLLLTCNRLPFIPSDDGGTWRRLRVAPWESEFVSVDANGLHNGKKLKANQFPRDNKLQDKLDKWKRAFMWLLLNRYYRIYKNEGLKEPEKVTQYTANYRKTNDIYFEFLDENIVKVKHEKGKRKYEKLEAIYASFRHWYTNTISGGKCPNKKDLQTYMENHGYKIKQGFVLDVAYNIKLGFDDDDDDFDNINV